MGAELWLAQGRSEAQTKARAGEANRQGDSSAERSVRQHPTTRQAW
jgi:hypothetical protein